MPILNLSDLKEGMITAEAVKAQGRVVLGENSEITAKMLHLFKAWGVTEANIQLSSISQDSDEEVDLTDEEKQQIEKKVAGYFKFANLQNEIMGEIKRIMAKRETEEIVKQKAMDSLNQSE